MIVLHVTIQVKPEHTAEFLEIVRHDAEHSEQDEPGCLRFDVLRDRDDPIVSISTKSIATKLPWRHTARRRISSSILKRASHCSPPRGAPLRPERHSVRWRLAVKRSSPDIGDRRHH